MTKTKREQKVNKTRWAEWIYYAISMPMFVFLYNSSASWTVIFSFISAVLLIGFVLWIWQYRSLDELGQLRFMKSWMFSGISTLLVLGVGLILALPNAMSEGKSVPMVSIWIPYGALIFGAVSASLCNFYLRWQEGRE